MTIKHQNLNISAEDEKVVTNITDSPEGTITITLKNQRTNGQPETKVIDLSKHKLNLKIIDELQDLFVLRNPNGPNVGNISQIYTQKNYIETAFASTDEIIAFRESYIFLIPADNDDGINDEGVYYEYIWTGSDFELLGSTHINLSDYALLSDLDGKVDKITGKGLSTNDYTTLDKTKLDNIEEGATNTVVVDNLTTPDTDKALSANQGKILKDEIDTIIDYVYNQLGGT